MPVPIAPIAATAARYGTVALLAYLATRRLERREIRHQTEAALDCVPIGLTASRVKNRAQVNGSARFQRLYNIGKNRFSIDAALLARIRLKRA